MTNSNTTEQMKNLARKWQEGSITEAEKELFDTWYNSFEPVYKMRGTETNEEAEKRIYKTILEKGGIAAARNTGARLWPRILSVAAAVAAIVFGIWFFSARNHTSRPPELVSVPQDIAPGKNMATLSLAGGKTITLSDAHSGVIINASQIKYNDGSLVQHSSSGGVSSPAGVNRVLTVTTPRGGTYQITLPDGTKVWLNAASSLTYHAPLNGRGGVREVELVGEAYFEVFRNKLQPFVVNSKKMELTVLGTHFNVNAYPDEGSATTTLLEGSVRVGHAGLPNDRNAIVLKPDEQALVAGDTRIAIKQVDADDVIAWKNGLFVFDGESLESIMRKVARWYNVDIEYKNENLKKELFSGSVSKFSNVSALLLQLENTGPVKFEVTGTKVIVK